MPLPFTQGDWASLAAAIAAQIAASQAGQAASELCARMTVRPTRSRRTLIETLISSLMTAGVWAKLDGLYLFAAHDAQAAQLNWVGCAQDVTAVNAPPFQVDRGFSGNATSAYLDTNTPGTSLEKFTATSASLGVYVRTTFAGNAALDASASYGYINPNNTDGAVVLRATAAGSAITVSNGGVGTGLFAWSRDASNVSVYRAGTLLGSPAVAAASMVSTNASFLRSGTSFSARQLQMGFVGQGLTAGEHAALNTAVVAYLTAIGAN